MTPGRIDTTHGAIEVENLLAQSPPRFFATLSELGWYSTSHRHWIDDLALGAGDRVLEVGCATGALTAYLAEMGCRATGLDRSRDMIRYARTDHPDLDLHVGDATSLPYDDDVFDAVVAASVVNVVSDVEQVLAEMHRICAPGGAVSVLVPSTEFTDEDLGILIESLELTGFSRAALEKWHRSATKMSRTQLEMLLGSVGLEPTITRSYLEGMLITLTARSFRSQSGR